MDLLIYFQVDLTTYQKMIVPVNMGAHWSLAAIDFVRHRVVYYDSLQGISLMCLQRLRYTNYYHMYMQ